uniref:NAC domain-containing protein n=1 Tax=Leersia perrieri TaxID=77586 RepID=A0A0D9W574_9ORYZ
MAGASNLPPGFHFFPSDEELIVHFLRRKASLLPCRPDIVPTLILNRYDPWELNGKALQSGNQWYFFSNEIPTRSSPNGHWKSIAADETESNNWVVCRVFESSYDSQVSFHEEGMELSCLDEVFLSLDDYDEVSFAK